MNAHARIAVLNRGEAALRFLRALREYNLERGTGLRGVAFFTDPDADAPFVRMADEAVALGPALVGGVSAYCRHDAVLDRLRAERCDAVWPGWGFVSEDAAFVEKLEAAGLVFIGPSSTAMRLLGDKIAGKRLAERCGVSVAPWHVVDPADDDATLRAHAERIGFPLMLKAAAGGGGRGIRKVTAPGALATAMRDAREETRRAFGDGGLLMEACVVGARHVEVQFVAGADGRAEAFGLRDCSIQRRHQKVLEEAPSPVVDAEVEAALRASAVRLAEGAGYRGVGTAEFLYLPAERRWFFMEVNSRLQVEHTLTELLTGVDLVKVQLDIARGLPHEHAPAPGGGVPGGAGHAIEVRLNAEDPARGFAPAPGLLSVFRPPAGPGLRVDSGVQEGSSIAPEFDSMIAKVIAFGRTRAEALARLERGLGELSVVVEDGATNKAFLLDLVRRAPVRDATADTAWLDRAAAAGELDATRHLREAVLAAAALSHRARRELEVNRFFAESQDGIPQNLPEPAGVEVRLRAAGRGVSALVYSAGRGRYTINLGGVLQRVELVQRSANTATLTVGGARRDVLFSRGRAGLYVEIDGAGHHLEQLSGGVVKAASPAMVVHVAVEEGATVEAGQRLATLEAMKMEMPLCATEPGVVKSVLCRANQNVVAGQSLFVLATRGGGAEPQGLGDTGAPGEPPGFDLALMDAEGPDVEAAADAEVERLAHLLDTVMLGFDVAPEQTAALRAFFSDDQRFRSVRNPARLARLGRCLGVFADVESLFERNLLPLSGEPAAVSAEIAFYEFCRRHREGEKGIPAELQTALRRALARYGVAEAAASPLLRGAVWRMAVAHAHPELRHQLCSNVLRLLIDLHDAGATALGDDALRDVLQRVARLARPEFPFVADNALQASYQLFERSRFEARTAQVEARLRRALERLCALPAGDDASTRAMSELVHARHSLLPLLPPFTAPSHPAAALATEALLRRTYSLAEGGDLAQTLEGTLRVARLRLPADGPLRQARAVIATSADLDAALELALRDAAPGTAAELVLHDTPDAGFGERVGARVAGRPSTLARLTVTWADGGAVLRHRTFEPEPGSATLAELVLLRDIHPEAARRIELWRLSEFELTRLPSHELVYAFRGRARRNPSDERVFVFAEVRDVPEQTTAPLRARDTEHLLEFEHAWHEALRVLRDEQSRRPRRQRYAWNRLALHVRPVLHLDARGLVHLARRLEAPTRGLGLQKVVVRARVPDGDGLAVREFVVSNPSRHKMQVEVREPRMAPIRALRPYELRVIQARRLGTTYPYELVRMLVEDARTAAPPHPDMLHGEFTEYDLDPRDPAQLVPVERPWGENVAGVVVGVVSHRTELYPEGIRRVFLASDPTRSMGALAEPECRRIVAALDLAERERLPVEWVPVSAGARIAMDSGTENLDWTAVVLRRIVEFTRGGGEINVIVAGVNVGAQSYWNAEATMLMHCRGVLIMTPQASMVLTGKKALEYSGSVAAEDERGIGGFERVMGPNGQAQYFAQDLGQAFGILFEHYRFAYRMPGEATPRRAPSHDPIDRDVCAAPYRPVNGEGFTRVGDLFDAATNPDRKKPFAIRQLMGAVCDAEAGLLERFARMQNAETAVVCDTRIGGHAVCLVGIESRPLPRRGRAPLDGPDTWMGGTLFPRSSKKVARALNAASGVRPVVVLANLSGFDGSPESMRKLQLEYGAEIGRAVVQFEGPLVFVVVGRYHGGAYVVFSKALNPRLTALAVAGSHASVIGGGPAAAVVFPGEVRALANADARVVAAKAAIAAAPPATQPRLREQLDALLGEVILEKQGEVAARFDAIHSVERAVTVGSLDAVIPPERIRPEIVRVLDAASVGHPRGGARTPAT